MTENVALTPAPKAREEAAWVVAAKALADALASGSVRVRSPVKYEIVRG